MANRLTAHLGSFVFLAATTGALSLVTACGSKASNPPDNTGSGGSVAGGTGGSGNPAGGSNPGGGVANNGGVDNGSGGGAAGGVAQGGSGNDQGAGGDQPGAGGSPPANFSDLVGTAPDRNMVAAGQVCERIATIQCAGEAHCCSNPGRSFDACKATMKQGCIDSLYLDAITGNAMSGYDPGPASTIFSDYETKAGSCDTGVTLWGATLQGLRGLAPGTLASGASCQPAGLRQIPPVVPTPAEAAPYLASCADPANDACYATALSWTCSPRVGDGGKCFTTANCKDGLYCDNDKNVSVTGGHCHATLGTGSPCGFQTECASLLCKGGTCADPTQDNVFCLQ